MKILVSDPPFQCWSCGQGCGNPDYPKPVNRKCPQYCQPEKMIFPNLSPGFFIFFKPNS